MTLCGHGLASELRMMAGELERPGPPGQQERALSWCHVMWRRWAWKRGRSMLAPRSPMLRLRFTSGATQSRPAGPPPAPHLTLHLLSLHAAVVPVCLSGRVLTPWWYRQGHRQGGGAGGAAGGSET